MRFTAMFTKRLVMPAVVSVVGLSCSAAAAQRTLTHEAVIPAPVAQVWEAFTTKEGIESWMVPHAEIDLRIGGDIRTSYNPDSNLMDEHTIINRIISYEPRRMLSIQNAQAPAGFKNPDLFQQTWTVIYFEPISPQRTRVRTVGLNYGEGPAWDGVYEKFKAGNAFTLETLRRKFADQGVANDPQRVLELLQRLTQGHWIHQAVRPDGSRFYVRNTLERGPDGRSIVARGWIGNDLGMTPHSASLIWEAPEVEGGGIEFVDVNEVGEIARGEIRLTGPDGIEWDWSNVTRDGFRHHFRITMQFEDERHYRMRIFQLQPDAEATEVVEARFEHVAQLPAALLKMRQAPEAAATAPPGKAYACFLHPARDELSRRPTVEERRVLSEHRAYLTSLANQGRIIAGGRCQDPPLLPHGEGMQALEMPTVGVLILRAADDAEARALMEGDPAVKAGLFQARVNAMQLAFEPPPG